MLVLSRKPGERILIGNDVAVTVVEIRPGRVKIGIEAPQGVSIHRDEVVAAIQQAQHHAHDSTPAG